MTRFDAPVPALEVTTLLPNPQFSDVQSKNHSVDRKRTVNGKLYTYCKDEGTSRLTYTFLVTRHKSLEFQAFVDAYFDSKIRLTNHKGEVWEGYFDGNPFEISQARRAVGGQGGIEMDGFTVIFEGTQV